MFFFRWISQLLRFYFKRSLKRDIIDRFHWLYYDGRTDNSTWNNTFWLGVKTLKAPTDLWVFQEIIYEIKPDLIIECGTSHGGSALYYATIMDQIGHGSILSVDINEPLQKFKHKRITFLTGSSIDKSIIEQVYKKAESSKKVLLMLDSNHEMNHVLAEMDAYSSLVSKHSYMIVEDTHLNGNPIRPEFGPGPMEAVNVFLTKNRNFEIDTEREKLLLTFNKNGFLKRK